MCYCDYEPPSMYEVSTHAARKAHRCYECSRTIQPGERYEKVVGVWDGDFGTYKTCRHCLDLRKFVQERADCFCWSHGSIREDALDSAEEHRNIPGLFFGALRREVLIRRESRRVK